MSSEKDISSSEDLVIYYFSKPSVTKKKILSALIY